MKRQLLAVILVGAIAGCKSSEPQGDGGGAGDGPSTPFTHEYFPYYKGSIWQFEKKTENARTSTTTMDTVVLRVTAFDDSSKVATIKTSSLASDGSGGNGTFHLRKVSGTLEKSDDGQQSWVKLVNTVELANQSPGFILNGDVGKPSKMFGTIKASVTQGNATTGVGSFPVLVARKEYVSDGNDPYEYGHEAYEDWSATHGLVYAWRHYRDDSMGYPNTIALTFTHSLTGYEISSPESPLKSGTLPSYDTPPSAPDKLTVERPSATQGKISWNDRSLNEESFRIERKSGSGTFSEIGTVDWDTTSFVDNGLEEKSSYRYRVRAQNRSGYSAYSDEVLMPCFGAPSQPDIATPKFQVSTTSGNTYAYLYWWNPASETVAGFVVSYRKSGDSTWHEVSGLVPPSNEIIGKDRRTDVAIYWLVGKAGPLATYTESGSVSWPAGTYAFKVRGVRDSCDGPESREGEATTP